MIGEETSMTRHSNSNETPRRARLLALCLAIPLAVQAAPPQISGYAPAPLANYSAEQVVTVFGGGFAAGIAASVTGPDGRTTLLSSAKVKVESSSKVLLTARFRVAGTYQLRLTNREGTAGPVAIPVTDAPQPVIIGHSPAPVLRSDAEQIITFQGSGFRNNLSLTVAQPSGGGPTIYGLPIRNLTATQFQASMKLDRLGGYSVYVNDPDGAQSKPYNFQVSRIISTPAVSGVAPAVIRAASGIQKVMVTGSGFVDGLSVVLLLPYGGTLVPAPHQIRVLSATSLQLEMEFPVDGAYQLRVVNPDSGQTQDFAFTVSPALVSRLSLNGVEPAAVTASLPGQLLTFSGKGFGPGLFVMMIAPGGGVTYFGGDQVLNLSSSSFQISASLVSPGDYLFQAYNSTLEQTNAFKLTVGTPASGPVLSLYHPLVFTLGPQAQVVTLLGQNLKPGLTASVVLPDGRGPLPVEVLADSVSATGLQVRLALALEGLYTFQVTNPDGAQSAPFGVRTSTPGPSTPVLTGYAPSPLAAGPETRTLILSGSDFVQGLKITVTWPDGTTHLIPDAQVGSVSFARVLLNVALPQTGTYLINLVNPDTSQAPDLAVEVVEPSMDSVITSYLPGTPRPSLATQTLSIQGSGFAEGLSLSVTAPDGSNTVISGAAIQAVTTTSFLALVNLPVAGDYTLRVINPDGTVSAGFPLVCSSTWSQPVVTLVQLATLLSSDEPQTVTMRGLDLRPGFTVELYRAETLMETIAASAITRDETGDWHYPAVFLTPGRYSVRVINPDGASSVNYDFEVQ
jgi:hypothetical protein